MENNLASRLEAQSRLIDDLRRVSGSPGLSLGVFHHGRVIHTKHFGLRDVGRPESPDDDTVYHTASLLKIVSVSAVARLVTDRVLGWDIPIREYLPEFRRREDDLGMKATLRDLASNRTGLAVANFFWGQQYGEALLPESEIVRLTTYLPAVKPFRKAFIYSQWNYNLVQAVVEKVTGKSFVQYVKEIILDPLGLQSTTFGVPRTTNIMTPHAVADDGQCWQIPTNTMKDETTLAAGFGGKTTIKEIMHIYRSVLSAYNHQKEHGVDVTPNSPFTQLRTIFTPHIGIGGSHQQSYCLGSYRTTLPANLSCASFNFSLLRKKTPIFEGTARGKEILHHTGNIPGFFGSMFLVPETESGVVCLTNSTPFMDPTDFSAQHLLSILLDQEPAPNLVALARIAAKVQLQWYKQLSEYLESEKTDEPPSLPLLSYSGNYINKAANFYLNIKPTKTSLHLAVQGKLNTTYDLKPWKADIFYWAADRHNELCIRGMWPIPLPQWHLIKFEVSDGVVRSMEWHHDPLAEPEVFRKMENGQPMPRL